MWLSRESDSESEALWMNACGTIQFTPIIYDRVPVHSILVLLRPQAAHSEVTGHVTYAARPERGNMNFGFEVVRLRERSTELLLTGPLGPRR